MAGDHEEEAMKRVKDVVAACEQADKPLCRAVQVRRLVHRSSEYS